MMKYFYALFILFWAWFAVAAEVSIYAVTDLHCHVEAIRKLLPALQAARRTTPYAVTVDAGDAMQGTFEAAASHAAVPLALMHELGVDLWIPGNHDFELRPLRFAEFRGTVLGANWTTDAFRPEPWRMVERGGRRIAFIGLGEHNMHARLLPDTGVRMETPEEALRRVMPEVRRAKPDATVLVIHDGAFFRGGDLRSLLAPYPEINLVIGGHTHVQNAGERIGSAHYLQPGHHGDVFGVATLHFSDGAHGKLLAIESSLRKPAAEPAAFSAATEALLRETRRLGDETVALRPCGIAHAMTVAAQADCAIYAGRPVRQPLPSPITRRELFRLLPYENNLVTLDLTPAQLTALLTAERKLQKKNRRQAYYDNITIKFDRKGVPIREELPPTRSDGTIRVALCDYYAAGSGGLTKSVRAFPVAPRRVHLSLREALELPQFEAGERNQRENAR